MSNLVRIAFAALCLSAFVGAAPQPAQADPYRWCADYSSRGGGKNCYFVTWHQCQAAISGVGGFCSPNPWFTGRPVVTPEDVVVVRSKRRAVYY